MDRHASLPAAQLAARQVLGSAIAHAVRAGLERGNLIIVDRVVIRAEPRTISPPQEQGSTNALSVAGK